MDTLRILGCPTALDETVLFQELGLRSPNLVVRSALQSDGFHGVIVTFANPKVLKHALENSKIPTLPHVVADIDFVGLTVLHSPDDAHVDIIAVHGFGGHGFNTWCYHDQNVKIMWLSDILPREQPRARIMTFGYSSGVFTNSTASLDDLAKGLLHAIALKRRDISDPTRPLILVAHSFGGIIIKNALVICRNQDTYPDIGRATRGLMFLGTPHRGSSIANYGKMLSDIASICRTVATESLDTLRENSKDLIRLSENFLSLVKGPRISIVSFYEARKTKVSKWARSIVDDYSAIMGIQNEVTIPLDAGHTDLPRFRNRNSPNCEILLHHMRQIIDGFQSDTNHQDRLERQVPPSNALQSRVTLTTPKPKKDRSCVTYPKRLSDTSDLQQRDLVLDSIQANLDHQSSTGRPRCCVISGLGGGGKTKLALYYMQKWSGTYDYMFFVGADRAPKLAQEYANIARLLKIDDGNGLSNPGQATETMLEWFEATERWLLILDNVETVGFLDDYWPHGSGGTILVTSRITSIKLALPGNAAGIDVSGFSEVEAQEFLMKYCEAGRDLPAERSAAAASIAKRLGYLPMALMIIATFGAQTGLGLRKLDELLKQDAQYLLERQADSEVKYYEYTYRTVWKSNFDTLDKKSVAFLNVLALLDPDDIDGDLFCKPKAAIGSLFVKEIDYLEAVRSLRKYAFLEKKGDDHLRVHRLVQQAQLDRISGDELTKCVDQAIQVVRSAFPEQEMGMHMFNVWPACELALPHVLSLEEAYRRKKPHITEAAYLVDLICDSAWYLMEVGQLDVAFILLGTGERLCRDTEGDNSLRMARVWIGQAMVYANRNEYQLGGPLYQSALEVRRRRLPDDSQLLANSYMQVGLYYAHQGRYSAAIEEHWKAIAIRRRSSSRAPSLMALSYVNLSRCLQMLRRWDELEIVLDQSEQCHQDLDVEERDSYVAGTHYVRGCMALAQEEYQRALDCFTKTNDLRMKVYGRHSYSAASLHKLAVCQIKSNMKEQAELSLRSALEILGELKGASIAGRIARSEVLLSELLISQGQEAEGQSLEASAFRHYKEATGTTIHDKKEVDFDLLVPLIDR